MKEDRLNELLERCESPIERELLQNLYPHLTTDRAQELRAQHLIDYYDDMQLTVPDFAFPDIQIAIYCDGFASHGDREKFKKDRLQSRELQLRGWIVLRFAGSEINRDGEMVVDTVQQAITKQQSTEVSLMPEWLNEGEQPIPTRQTRQDYQRPQTQEKPGGGMCGVLFLASVIVGILVLLNFIF